VTRPDLPFGLRGTPVDAIEEPVSGQLVVFRQRTSERVAGDLFVRPGGFVPVHVHAGQLERFEGVSGALRFKCGRQRGTLGPGDEVIVPAGTAHGFRNVGPEVAHFLIELTPPLRGGEGLRTLFGLQRDGRMRITRLGVPRPVLQIAVLFDEYLDEIHLPLVPLRVQRVMFRALSRLGKWRGYRSTFPEYTRTPERGSGETGSQLNPLHDSGWEGRMQSGRPKPDRVRSVSAASRWPAVDRAKTKAAPRCRTSRGQRAPAVPAHF
jgi:mannose-6-phosphate isomerase-like protein (cupin superfamily)